MKKILPSLLIISFILWVLPLGYFIKPSQQKIACDGQRAMCMCYCMMGHKPSDKAMEAGIIFKAGSPNKENSSGGSNYFVSSKPATVLNFNSSSFFLDQYLCYKNPTLAALEYVPKF